MVIDHAVSTRWSFSLRGGELLPADSFCVTCVPIADSPHRRLLNLVIPFPVPQIQVQFLIRFVVIGIAYTQRDWPLSLQIKQ